MARHVTTVAGTTVVAEDTVLLPAMIAAVAVTMTAEVATTTVGVAAGMTITAVAATTRHSVLLLVQWSAQRTASLYPGWRPTARGRI